jgi:NAD(P)-dependent dehydrogenase (short-subunit alcohol dehydrogenase family)
LKHRGEIRGVPIAQRGRQAMSTSSNDISPPLVVRSEIESGARADPARRPRSWLITGVSSGLGRALAQTALSRGDHVAGTVRTPRAKASFEALAPGRAHGVRLDVADRSDVRRAVAALEPFLDGIDVLVSNAGYGLVGGVEEASDEEIQAQFDVNVFGALALIQSVLPFMRQRRAGRIVCISAVSGLVGWPSLGIYCGSKFALEGICESLAFELTAVGVKLTLIEPGRLRTEFARRSARHAQRTITDYDETVGACKRILAEHAGHEPGDPQKAARAILAVVDAPEPPLRLILGRDALRYTEEKLARLQGELEHWRALSLSIGVDE